MFYVYVLKSSRDSKLYIGHTNNLKKRFKEHSEGKVESTKYRRPLKIIYYEASILLDDAIKREHSLKTGYGRRYLKNRLTEC